MKRNSMICCPLILLVVLLAGCALPPGLMRDPASLAAPRFLHGAFASPSLSDEEKEVEEEEEEDERAGTVLGTVILYIPNRIFDLVEIVRAGVNVGVGLGVDARATWLAQAVVIHDTSVGAGWQGLRHLPICARIGHSTMGAGPISTPRLGLFDWPVNDYDVRLELFFLLVGAHAAVDLEAIWDFTAGLLTFDPSDDDFIL